MSVTISLSCDYDDGRWGSESVICPVVFHATPMAIAAATITTPAGVSVHGTDVHPIDITRALAHRDGWTASTTHPMGGRDFCPNHSPKN